MSGCPGARGSSLTPAIAPRDPQVAIKTKKLKTCWKKLQAARNELKQAQVAKPLALRWLLVAATGL